MDDRIGQAAIIRSNGGDDDLHGAQLSGWSLRLLANVNRYNDEQCIVHERLVPTQSGPDNRTVDFAK
jgi:hypothetical protein